MFPGGRRKSEHLNSFPLPTPQSDELADWRAPWAAVVSPLGFREFALGSNSFGPAQDGHRAIPPDAVFLVSQSINMKQQPSPCSNRLTSALPRVSMLWPVISTMSK